ncbi:MAG: spermidine/putrescine ABC transporter permease PotC, partial [Treponema sp.]|nr:spermidine/putrescine ABC transporter permease PotC [Treponema sp.]
MTNIFFVLLNSLKKRPRSESERHARKSWKQRASSISFSNTVLFFTLLFLFLPLIVVIINSFNQSKGPEFTKFSFVWYKELIFHSRPLWEALLNSVIVAITSALVATLLGSL